MLLKSVQKFWGNAITKVSRLSDRMTWTQHTFRSSLEVSLNHFYSLSIKEICERSTEGGHENAFQNAACRLASEGYIIFVWILQQSILHTRCSFLLYKDAYGKVSVYLE